MTQNAVQVYLNALEIASSRKTTRTNAQTTLCSNQSPRSTTTTPTHVPPPKHRHPTQLVSEFDRSDRPRVLPPFTRSNTSSYVISDNQHASFAPTCYAFTRNLALILS